jgi:CRISPR-associated protein Csh2
MNNRVYGIIGIKSTMANWNADFTKRPKTLSNGDIFGSDKALKYSIRKNWVDNGEKVLYFKSFKIDNKGKGEEKDKIQPMELEEKYNQVFYPNVIDEKTSSNEVLKNLFSAVDVLNFGATFAVKKQNISITGVVQINQGFNKYSETQIETQDILSPFRNSNKKDADASSLGNMTVTDEAHYFYGFSVNPLNVENYKGVLDGFKGYSEEAYKKFKMASLVGATALNTNSKSGCENEFAMFVELKKDSSVYIPDLAQFIKFYKENEKSIIDLEDLKILKEDKIFGEVEKIEIYYNPYTVELKNADLKNVKYFNLFTLENINR